MRKVIAKIDLENIKSNAKAFAALTEKPVCAVVKANAYGHGAEETVNALEGLVDCFAVSLLSEATALRVAACGKDILIFSPPLGEEQAYAAAQNGFVMTVGDLATANMLAALSRKRHIPVRVHLKANTGMNRYGCNLQTLGKACKLFAASPLIRVEGLYSHLYTYDSGTAHTQRLRFLRAQALVKGYFPRCICHLSATYGALLGEEFRFDMTRIGIGLYGYLPDGVICENGITAQTLGLKKAMTVWADVTACRRYADGGAGYGTPKTSLEKGEFLSTLRFGYADGFLRQAQNGVCGFEKNANNLCMDACVRKGKEKQGTLVPVMTDAAETAKKTGTISYEVLCAATRRAEMVYDDVAFCGRRKYKR